MNIAAIQTFLSVVRTGNLNRAANELNVTQSAVTARLDTLEQTLGAQLLVRSRKGAELTKPGFAFLEKAELIARTWDNARAHASLPKGVTQLFSFVCDPALWPDLGANWIKRLRENHPEVAIEIWDGLAFDARRWLQSGMGDAALLSTPLTGPDFDSREFSSDSLLQVSTQARLVVRWDPNYVMVDYGPAFRIWHSETWPGDDTAPLSFSNPGWALAHLLSDGGSAYLPADLAAEHIAAHRLHRVDGAPDYTRRTHLTWRKPGESSFPWLVGG